jgi:hypothetical protein
MRTNIFITIAFIWIAFIIAYALVGTCEASNIVIIGQSNADLLAKNGHFDDNIINCGHHGQHIIKFMPDWSASSFYGDCIKKIGKRKIDNIIFWQGEQDTIELNDYTYWKACAKAVIKGLMDDAGTNKTKIIMVVLNDKPHSMKYWLSIRNTQLNLSAPNMVRIDSSYYEFEPGNIHLTAFGYQSIADDINLLIHSK